MRSPFLSPPPTARCARHQSMASILAVLAQDPDTGIITYGDTNIRHEHKNQVVLEFLDFYGEQSEIKPRYLVFDQIISLKDYGGELRQVAIAGHGRIKPALIITNDFQLTCSEVIRKYARRWLVEKDISQQIEFFHFNRISSSMVIKVDFDLTMSILAPLFATLVC